MYTYLYKMVRELCTHVRYMSTNALWYNNVLMYNLKSINCKKLQIILLILGVNKYISYFRSNLKVTILTIGGDPNAPT